MMPTCTACGAQLPSLKVAREPCSKAHECCGAAPGAVIGHTLNVAHYMLLLTRQQLGCDYPLPPDKPLGTAGRGYA